MTNGEKFKEIFKEFATEVWAFPEKDFLTWLNAEYKEPTAKNEAKYCDRNICLKNEYNNIGCEDCEVTKSQKLTTKNDLGDDCISRKRVLEWLENATDDSIEHALDSDLEFIPSVTPQEPISDILEDIYAEIENEYEDCVIGKLDDDEMYPCFRKIDSIYGLMDTIIGKYIDKYKAESEET